MTVNVSKPVVNVREKLAELDKPTGIAGEAMLRAETPQEQQALIGVGRRNVIINGAMQVAQRGTSGTGTGYQSVDRFRLDEQTGAGVGTLSQESDGPMTSDGKFKYYFQVNVDTADTSVGSTEYVLVSYKVEDKDFDKFGFGSSNAKGFTLSFYHAHSIAGTYCLSLRNSGAGSNRNYLIEYHQDVANEWQKTTVYVSGDTGGTWTSSNGSAISISFTMHQGTAYQGTTVDQWFSGTYYHSTPNQVNMFTETNAKFRITGVQLELGKVATPFEHRSYGEELALCQRYYQKSYDSNSFAGDNDGAGAIAFIPTNTSDDINVNLPVFMRASPNITVYRKNGGATNQAQRADNAASYINLTVGEISERGFSITPATAVSDRHYRIHYLADAEL